jgi:hypothetical protein
VKWANLKMNQIYEIYNRGYALLILRIKHQSEQSPACAVPQLLPDLSLFRKVRIARTVSVKFNAFELFSIERKKEK